MNFDELDQRMRSYETAHDQYIAPNIHLIARLDGKGFTKLTKEKLDFTRPFDVRFHDIMCDTVKHLADCGFKVIYAYTESDEISLLFDLHINNYQRKLRKFESILAGEASAKFSLLINQIAVFDCRICQLPTPESVIDYFSWRKEDANRNSLNAYCYWTLREQGLSPELAAQTTSGKSLQDKIALLNARHIDIHNIPNWQRYGTALYQTSLTKTGFNPKTQSETQTIRKQFIIDDNLPAQTDYRAWLKEYLEKTTEN